MDVHGIDGQNRYMMVTMTRRKQVQCVIRIVNSIAKNAVITVSDVKVQKGGYLRNTSTRPHPYNKQRAKWESKVSPVAAKKRDCDTPCSCEDTPQAEIVSHESHSGEKE